MTILIFSILLLVISILAGLIGALTGLGGGVVLIPALVLIFHINIYYAMGASLISVIATSSGSAAAYLKKDFTNVRIGMFLEMGAVVGALIGAALVPFIPIQFIAVIFAVFLFISAFLTIARNEKNTFGQASHAWAIKLRMESLSPDSGYSVQRVPLALSIMALAGCLSGLLGIGSGALKVLAMDQAMRLPYKVATTTSNFIIGITAAVSAGIYFANGYIIPGIIFPVMIGVTTGTLLGSKLLINMPSKHLRITFSIVICLLGLEMLYKALTGAI